MPTEHQGDSVNLITVSGGTAVNSKVSAAHVSRVLRAAGFGIVPDRRREGTLVSKGLEVSVTAQFDSEMKAVKHAMAVVETLEEVGYVVRRVDQIVYVMSRKVVKAPKSVSAEEIATNAKVRHYDI
jgi:hypothetical protein